MLFRGISGKAELGRLRFFSEERGLVDVFLCGFLLALSVYIIYGFVTLAREDANSPSVLNDPVVSVPVSSCEIQGGIVREDSVVRLSVVDRSGRVVAAVSEARVFSVTDRNVWVVVKARDASGLPSGSELSVNRLKVVLEPVKPTVRD